MSYKSIRGDFGKYTPVKKTIQGDRVVSQPLGERPIGPIGQWTDQQKRDALASRLVQRYGNLRKLNDSAIEIGASLFPAQRETSEFLASEAGLPSTEATSSILATLSTPTSQAVEHNVGRVAALQLLERAGDSKFQFHITRANTHAQTIHALSREPGGKERYAPEIMRLQGEIERAKQGAGIVGTPLGLFDIPTIHTAYRMLRGETKSPLENTGISTTQGRAASPVRFKESNIVRDLAQQIETGGNSSSFPVDADIYDALLRPPNKHSSRFGRTDIPYDFGRGFSNDMNYGNLQKVGETAFTAIRRRSTSGLFPGFDKISDFLNAIHQDQQDKNEYSKSRVGKPGVPGTLSYFVHHNPQTNPRRHGLPPLNLPMSFGM